MAKITVPAENRTLTETAAMREFLAPYGIWHERWDVDGRLGAEATADEILEAYRPEIDRLKRKGGYVTADVINVSPETPNLQSMLDKFNKEHIHTEDEVRFIVKGRGVFHVNPNCAPGEAPPKGASATSGPVFAIEVEAGDLINVPANTRHWFDLCADRSIRAIRLFLDMSGWTPCYMDDGVHAQYQPLCMGPSYVGAESGAHPGIRI